MKKLIVFFLVAFPFIVLAQEEKAMLDKELRQFIVATNEMDCGTLLYYAPKLVFKDQTEAEFIFNCELNKLNRSEHVKKTMMPRFIIDTLVISRNSKYAKIRIPIEVEVRFTEADVIVEENHDTFHYDLMEAYCESIENRSDVRATFVDFEEQKVYYTCHKNVLGQWENNHWTFQ